MTTPTQAQIEAAIGVYGIHLSSIYAEGKKPSPGDLRIAMSAALTAATEVDVRSDPNQAVTVERCAQVADKYAKLDIRSNPAKDIAAEIRTLT